MTEPTEPRGSLGHRGLGVFVVATSPRGFPSRRRRPLLLRIARVLPGERHGVQLADGGDASSPHGVSICDFGSPSNGVDASSSGSGTSGGPYRRRRVAALLSTVPPTPEAAPDATRSSEPWPYSQCASTVRRQWNRAGSSPPSPVGRTHGVTSRRQRALPRGARRRHVARLARLGVPIARMTCVCESPAAHFAERTCLVRIQPATSAFATPCRELDERSARRAR